MMRVYITETIQRERDGKSRDAAEKHKSFEKVKR